MSSVTFYSWEKAEIKYSSYHDLKARQEYKKNALDRILKKHSPLSAEQVIEVREEMLSGRPITIPAVNLDQAEEMAKALTMLGANILLREMDNACLCEYCNTVTVIQIAEDPPGFRLFCCAKCNELKRACPECCGQGWLRHYHSKVSQDDIYTCDDCGAAWSADPNEMKPTGKCCSWDEAWRANSNEMKPTGECCASDQIYVDMPELVRDFL